MNDDNTVYIIEMGPGLALAISGDKALFIMGDQALRLSTERAIAFVEAVAAGKSFQESIAGLDLNETEFFDFAHGADHFNKDMSDVN